jgi:hypothetical protein
VFQKGPHGLGLGPKGNPFAAWPELCAHWLKVNKMLEKKK